MKPAAVFYVLAFAGALFVNGAALALAEPHARLLLLRLGSTPTMWASGTLFFQVMFFLGCAYAEVTVRVFGVRWQATLHLGLLLLALMWWAMALAGLGPPFPLTDLVVSAFPTDASSQEFALLVFALLSGTIGIPLFAMTTCIPLVQRWFADTGHPQAREPYFLYASCSLGSLAGQVGYPVFEEPFFGTTEQQGRWLVVSSVLSILLAVGCVALLRLSRSFFQPLAAEEQVDVQSVLAKPVSGAESPCPPAAATILRRLHWMALSAVPIALASALPTYIAAEVSAIPLFYMIPLILLQLTLILAFARQPLFARLPCRVRAAIQLTYALAVVACLLTLWRNRPPSAGAPPGPMTSGVWLILVSLLLLIPQALAIAVQPVMLLLVVFGVLTQIWVLPQLAVHLLAVFVTMRCCHGELAQERPPTEGLTGYFVCIAAGGALGGLFAAVLAPLLFRTEFGDYWLALMLACMLRPGSTRNGLSDLLIARGLCVLWQCRAATARLLRAVAAVVLDWLYPLLVGVLTVELWVHKEAIKLLLASLGVAGPGQRDALLCGLPLLLCLVAVARRVRFGLSLGAVLLAMSLAPRAEEMDAVTLVPGIPDAAATRMVLPLALLPLVVGTVVVFAGLLSVLLAGAADPRLQHPQGFASPTPSPPGTIDPGENPIA